MNARYIHVCEYMSMCVLCAAPECERKHQILLDQTAEQLWGSVWQPREAQIQAQVCVYSEEKGSVRVCV